MKHNGIYYLKLYSLVFFGILVCGYSIFQAQKIIRGPRITILSPLNGLTYTTPLIDIKGVAKNVSTLLLNDRPLYPDKTGDFSDRLLLLPGYNILKFEARDRFGSVAKKKIEIIYQERL